MQTRPAGRRKLRVVAVPVPMNVDPFSSFHPAGTSNFDPFPAGDDEARFSPHTQKLLPRKKPCENRWPEHPFMGLMPFPPPPPPILPAAGTPPISGSSYAHAAAACALIQRPTQQASAERGSGHASHRQRALPCRARMYARWCWRAARLRRRHRHRPRSRGRRCGQPPRLHPRQLRRG